MTTAWKWLNNGTRPKWQEVANYNKWIKEFWSEWQPLCLRDNVITQESRVHFEKNKRRNLKPNKVEKLFVITKWYDTDLSKVTLPLIKLITNSNSKMSKWTKSIYPPLFFFSSQVEFAFEGE